MNRMDEYTALLAELEQTPKALDRYCKQSTE